MIIFDLDGTLINSERFLKEIEAELKCELGFFISYEEQAKRFGGIGPHQQLQMDPSLPAEFASLAEQRFRERAGGRLCANPGVVDFLSNCSEKCVIASNGPLEWIEHALGVTGLESFFEPNDLFHAGLVANKKPAPDLHLLASQNAEDRKNVVAVEDSLVGVQAAVSAQIPVVGYTGASPRAEELEAAMLEAGAEGVATKFLELRSYFNA